MKNQAVLTETESGFINSANYNRLWLNRERGCNMLRTCVIISILCLLSAQEVKWRWISPVPTDGMFLDVDFYDAQNGFAVDFEGGQILQTTDGGQTWKVSWPLPPTNPGYYRLMAISYPAIDTAYAVGWWGGTDWQGSRGYVMCKTTNRGQTWILSRVEDSFRGLNDVCFVNSRTGYAVGRCYSNNPAIILKTTNAGETWQTQNSGLYGDLWSVYFVNENIGYAVGDTILKTTNGGTTWIRLSYIPAGTLRAVQFPVDQNTGYACGYYYNGVGVIIKTTNGGSNWQTLAGGSSYDRYHGLYFIDNQTGYVAGYDQTNGLTIRKTTNGGSSWSHYPVNYNYYYAQKVGIDFVNQNTGYVAGYRYLGNSGQAFILKTTNAGSNWNTLLPVSGQLPDYNFLDMDLKFLVSHQIGYIVGGLGKIAKTTDGGTTWFLQNTGTGQTFRTVCFITPDTGWAGGENGTLFYTTDGGNTWIPRNSGTMDNINKIYFLNDSIGYFGVSHLWQQGGYQGYDSIGYIYKTTNGGHSWFLLADFPIGVYGIAFPVSSDTGYVCGQGFRTSSPTGTIARIYKTTNGGTSWTQQYISPSGTSTYLYCMQFFNNQLGYCAGSEGPNGYYKFFKTTNGGTTWTKVQFADYCGLVPAVGLHFPTPDTGYLTMPTAGYHLMMKTTNSGTNWTPINLQTQHSPNTVYFINGTVGFIAGTGGMIRKTTNGGSVWIVEEEKDENLEVENSNSVLVVYPNPFRDRTIIKYMIHDTGYKIQDTGLKIYDVSGRMVRDFSRLTVNGERSTILWDGTDDLGRRVPSGVYFIRLENDELKQTEKVILLR